MSTPWHSTASNVSPPSVSCARSLDEPRQLAGVLVFRGEPSARFVEHLAGGVEDGDLIAFAQKRDRLLARAASHVHDAGRRSRAVLGQPAVDELVADYPAQGSTRRVVASGEAGEEVLHGNGYFPSFRNFSNSARGRQLITLPFSTQARLACETPYFM